MTWRKCAGRNCKKFRSWSSEDERHVLYQIVMGSSKLKAFIVQFWQFEKYEIEGFNNGVLAVWKVRSGAKEMCFKSYVTDGD